MDSSLLYSGISSNCGGAGGVLSLISIGLSDLAISPIKPANLIKVGSPRYTKKIKAKIERKTYKYAFFIFFLSSTKASREYLFI